MGSNISKSYFKYSAAVFFLPFFFFNQHFVGQNSYLKTDTSIYIKSNIHDPKVDKKWEQGIKEISIPIKSIDSDDFKDLEFLKNVLKDKRVIMLGESSHRVDEYSKLKGRLIKFLHEQMDFDVLVFENGMPEVEFMNKNRDTLSVDRMLKCILWIWSTEANKNLMTYIKNNNSLQVAGIDYQFSSNYSWQYFKHKNMWFGYDLFRVDSNACYYIVNNTVNHNDRNGKIQFDSIIHCYIDTFSLALRHIKTNLPILIQAHISEVNLKYTERILENRILFFKAIISSNGKKGFHSDGKEFYNRDSIMADNFLFLFREIYPDRKIIVWAHNDHISRYGGLFKNSYMGGILNKELKDKEYVIGLYGYAGETDDYKNRFNFIKPSKNSLEAILHKNEYKYSFVPLEKESLNKKNDWMNKRVKSLYWGVTIHNIIPVENYDAVFFIDKVSVPIYVE